MNDLWMDKALNSTPEDPYTVYIGGPMTGRERMNFPMFDAVKAAIERERGWTVASPADHDRDVLGWEAVEASKGWQVGDLAQYERDTGFDFGSFIGWDFQRIIESDGIVLLPGWEHSNGATHERYVAEVCGKDIWLVVNDGEALDPALVGNLRVALDVRDVPNRSLVLDTRKMVSARRDLDLKPDPDYIFTDQGLEDLRRQWLPDSQPVEGKRVFESGANRNPADHKHDYEGFLSILALRSYGNYMHSNRTLADGTLRDSDNWQKGIPRDVYVKSLLRHVFDVWELHRSGEDALTDFDGNLTDMEHSLGGVLFNAFGLLHEVLLGRSA